MSVLSFCEKNGNAGTLRSVSVVMSELRLTWNSCVKWPPPEVDAAEPGVRREGRIVVDGGRQRADGAREVVAVAFLQHVAQGEVDRHVVQDGKAPTRRERRKH